jgi:hypothetical protein
MNNQLNVRVANAVENVERAIAAARRATEVARSAAQEASRAVESKSHIITVRLARNSKAAAEEAAKTASGVVEAAEKAKDAISLQITKVKAEYNQKQKSLINTLERKKWRKVNYVLQKMLH